MADKINGVGSSGTAPVSDGQPVRRTQDATVSDGKSSPAQPAPTVTITDAARQLAALEQAVQAAPAVNQPKVAAISKSIDDGTYTVDSEKVADKLLQSERALQVAGPTAR